MDEIINEFDIIKPPKHRILYTNNSIIISAMSIINKNNYLNYYLFIRVLPTDYHINVGNVF